ncbi:putative DD34D transposase [Trichonephila clavipes]|nr:putative DD34D transposase [Trichonephila clavipes]
MRNAPHTTHFSSPNIVQKGWWSKHGETAQTMTKPGRFYCTFGRTGKGIYCELLPHGQTLNLGINCQQLKHLKLAIDQKLPELANRRGVAFHQENVRADMSVVTRQKLQELVWEVLMSPPYSPDLAPSNCPVFLAL